MGAYFLHEEVRTLGRLGCATCLLGSIMLVLHAPPDKEIQGIDEIIHLSIQPCISNCSLPQVSILTPLCSVSTLLLLRNDLLHILDLFCCSKVGQDKPTSLHRHLLYSWLYLRHGSKSLYHRRQTHNRRREPVPQSLNLHIPHRPHRNPPNANELPQQSNGHLPRLTVRVPLSFPQLASVPTLNPIQHQRYVLRPLHNLHPLRILHPLRRLQHHRRYNNHLPNLRFPPQFPRHSSPNPLQNR